MKRQDIIKLVFVAVISAFLSLILSNLIFKTPSSRSTQVPTADVIPSSLPDLKNDSTYRLFFNSNAIDLTQPVQIGNTQNTTPFNGSQ